MITAEQAKELLAAAPGPWVERLGPPTHRAVAVQWGLYATPGDVELLSAAPDLAQTVIDLSAQIAEARRALEFMDVAGVQTALGGDQR